MCWFLHPNGNLSIYILVILIILLLIPKIIAKGLSLFLKQKVFCFGFVFFWKGNSSCLVWEGMKSEWGLLTSLWETNKNGSGGQARADGYLAVSLPSSREGVSTCHVEQPVIGCREISISQSWRKGERFWKPKAANQKEVWGTEDGSQVLGTKGGIEGGLGVGCSSTKSCSRNLRPLFWRVLATERKEDLFWFKFKKS